MMRNDINFALVVMVKAAADIPQNGSLNTGQNASLSNVTSITPVAVRLSSVSMIVQRPLKNHTNVFLFKYRFNQFSDIHRTVPILASLIGHLVFNR